MKTLIVLIALIVVGVFGWMYFVQPGMLPQFRIEEGSGEPTKAPEATYSENEEYYAVSAVYPDEPAVERAVMDAISQFKKDGNFENLTPQDIEIQGLGGERKYSLDISYKTYTSSGYTSYVLTMYSDTLGAHPNTFFRTFTFDEEGREVVLEDLFEPGASFLPRIAEKVYAGVMADLRARAGAITPDMEDTVRLGTSPTPETLQFYYLDGENLHILIPPYQAAAYAAGSFDIAVPLSELNDILR